MCTYAIMSRVTVILDVGATKLSISILKMGRALSGSGGCLERDIVGREDWRLGLLERSDPTLKAQIHSDDGVR